MDNKTQDNKDSGLYNFLRALAIGFGIVSIGIAIALIGYFISVIK